MSAGAGGAAVGAVAAGLVGRGVDVHVGARRGGADPEPGGAEVADQVGEAEQGLADQQIGDAGGLVGDVDVQVGRVVVRDPWRDRVALEQRVDHVDHPLRVVVGRGHERRAQVLLEAPEDDCIAVGDL